MTVSLTDGQYAELLAWAQDGADADSDLAEFLVLRDAIDAANSITRYTLVVRYQAVPAGAAPAVTSGTYPPYTSIIIERTRPITREDVDAELEGIATSPDLTYVTPDPQGIVGWAALTDHTF